MKQDSIKYILISLFSFLFITTNAQSSWSLQGVVLDSISEPMVGATVMLTQLTNDKLEGFAITDPEGRFTIDSKKSGAFKLQITYVGYGTFEREVNLSEGDELVDFGDIILRPDAFDLAGVTVKDSFIPIVIKKDTIEYHADAFKTPPNASVEDLLKKLPGVEVEKDGTIKAQGEEVQQIFVDGKEFFDDDPKIASRNIPADVVNKVQVFDKKSDFTEFTGIDDGNESKAINLKIKEGKNKGTFGNVKGAYGTDDRYQASTSINRFDSKMQLAVLGNSNNTNEQAFSLMDYLDFTGGLEDVMNGGEIDVSQLPTNLMDNSGETDTYSGGVNFNYDFNKKTSLRSNYFYDRSDNQTAVDGRFQRLLDEGVFSNDAQSDQFNRLSNHRLTLKLNQKFDDSQDLKGTFKLGFSDNEKRNSGSSKSFVANELLSNQSISNNHSVFLTSSWSSKLNYRKKLKKKGRFFTAGVDLEGRENDGDNELNNDVTLFSTPPSQDSIAQKQNTDFSNFLYRLNVNYVEPLGTAKYLSFSASRANNTASNEKTFLDKTKTNTYIVNDFLSNNFERTFTEHKAGLAFKRIWTDLNFSIGTDFQVIDVNNHDLKRKTEFGKPFKNILPNARLNYQLSQSSQLQVNYTTRVNVPNIDQIQPVINNVDPLNIYVGNQDLNAEYIHRLNVNFSNLNQFYFRNIFLGLNAQYIQNTITETESVDDQLVSVRTPINSKATWRIGSYYDYSSPIRGINVKLAYNGRIQFQKSNVLINEVLDRTLFTEWNQTISIENKKKAKVDWSGGIRLKSNFTNYQRSQNEDQQFFDYSFFTDFIWPIKNNWTFETNLEHQRYAKTSFADAAHFNFVNATITKSFLDGKLSLYLKGVNLLNEELMIQRSSFGNQYNETIKNRLGRYVLFGAVFNIRSFGK